MGQSEAPARGESCRQTATPCTLPLPRQSFTRQVFIQDWKGHEGWAQLTKQPGEEGARQSVILSLLVDHSLFLHPDQQAQLKNNLPAYTVGSLRAHVQV